MRSEGYSSRSVCLCVCVCVSAAPVPLLVSQAELEPGTKEWNETWYRYYTWSMLNRSFWLQPR